MALDFPTFMATAKTLSGALEWYPIGNVLKIVASIDADGATVPGIQFVGETPLLHYQRDVTFVLGYLGDRNPRLGRLDWKPTHQHSNKAKGPREWRYRVQSGSHAHSFDLNWIAGEARLLSGNLPVAVPFEVDPPDYWALLVFAAQHFKITNLSSLPAPPWQPPLVLEP